MEDKDKKLNLVFDGKDIVAGEGDEAILEGPPYQPQLNNEYEPEEDEDISGEQLEEMEKIAVKHLEEDSGEETLEEMNKRYAETMALSSTIDYLKGVYNSEEEPPSQKQEDLTNPSHYKTMERESIDIMELKYGTRPVLAFCVLNADKYIQRAPHKGNYTLDIEKAEWYLSKYEELIEKIESGHEVKGLTSYISAFF